MLDKVEVERKMTSKSVGLFFQDDFSKGCDLERCWERQRYRRREMFVGKCAGKGE